MHTDKRLNAKLVILVALLMVTSALLAACGDSTATTAPTTTAAATTAAATTAAATTAAATTAAGTTTAAGATTAAATTTAAAATTAAATTTAATSAGASVTPPGGYKVAANVTLSGSGASFPNPVYQEWIKAFATANPSVKLNYNSVGSGAGRKSFFAGEVDFAGSDGYPSDKEIADYKTASKKDIYTIPTTLGAVVLAFNLPGVTDLKLSPDLVGAIFTGKITKWDDAKIAAENSGAKLPSTPISIAVRQDDSGTTSVFSNWLAEVYPDFASLKIAGSTVAWETAGITVQKAPKNDGVTGLVKQNAGTIGYIESSYAQANNVTYASMKNPAGNYVKADIASISAAAAGGTVPDNLKLKVTQSADPKAYPITATTWIIIPRDFDNKDKAEAVLKYLWWVTSDAAPIKIGSDLGYAPLPAAVVAKVQATLLTVTAAGQPVLK